MSFQLFLSVSISYLLYGALFDSTVVTQYYCTMKLPETSINTINVFGIEGDFQEQLWKPWNKQKRKIQK